MNMTTQKIYGNVTLGEGTIVEDFCIVGTPPRGAKDGELPTTIGDDSVIRSHTVIYAGNVIGAHFQTGNKVNIRESNRIGNNVSIGTLSVIEHHVEIADNVRIHTQVFIPEFSVLGGMLDRTERGVHEREVSALTWSQGFPRWSCHQEGRKDRRQQHHSPRRRHWRERAGRCGIRGRQRRARRRRGGR
jgi:carbonic anhydrase/acetyltransferase-like protein (isoleucine patch superfamily)